MVGRVLVLWCSFALMACGGDSADAPVPIRYRVLSYDYAFDLTTRAAAASLTLEIIEAGNCVSIPMRADDLSNVRLDGELIASASVEAGVLGACGHGWPSGSQIELSANIVIPNTRWLPTQVGYSVSVDAEGNPFTYLVGWIGGCDRFGPCDSAPGQFASYRFTVDHPMGTLVTCPGTITPTPTQTTCEFNFVGGPTYSTFGVAASPSWTQTNMGVWGGRVAVSLYDSPSTGAAARFDAATHQQFFEWMETTFGPYPYGDELRFIIAPTYWGGFEHPGNIVLADSLSVTGQTSTVHHELVHMWAGNRTTLADTYDFVWKEAIANYLPFVYMDEQIDAARAIAIARSWRAGTRGVSYHLVPGEKPPLIDYYGHVYSAGPMILFRQLEALFDRATIIAALQDFLAEPRAASVEDLKLALETATGADLTNYFNAWVYGTGAPTVPVFDVLTIDQGGGNVEVRVTQVDAANGTFGCAFTITLTGDLGESFDVWVDRGVDGIATTTQVVSPGFAVTGHVFDSNVQCAGVQAPAAAFAGPAHFNEFLAPTPPIPWN